MAEAWDEGGAIVKRIKQRIDERIREECDAIVADEDDVCDRHKINATDMANGLKRFYNDNCGGGGDSSRGGEKRVRECEGDEEIGEMIDNVAQVSDYTQYGL